MSVLFILLASALSVSAQSNLNCSVFNISEVPVDFVPIINLYQQNDSHAEYGNLSNFNWTVACKSNITSIDAGCTGNYVNLLQLYNETDAHVSVDNYYSNAVCLNTSNSSVTWMYNISAVGAVPTDYVCLFSIYDMNDSHVYSCDSPDAAYDVNLRISAAPSGSIVIVGPNGTELTGSMNVFLNMTFESGIGIDKCRLANDNMSNLNSAVWEECLGVRPWILSDEQGNKTVYFQIKDILGGIITLSDHITYSFTQDYTAPSVPTVYDGLEGEDIDWWNSNTSLSAHWFNSTEDVSAIYYRYRIFENSSCYNNDCNWTDAFDSTSVTITNLSLKEGSLYYFEVQSYNPFNLSGGSAVSDGARIDLTPPGSPIINSSTHPDENATYQISDPEFNWTAFDIEINGNMSGIAGYSFELDSYPGTAPDDVMDDRYGEVIVESVNDGSAQVLRANASISSPNTYAVFQSLHTNFTVGDSVKLTAAIAELVSDYADLMGVEVYLAKVSNGASISAFDQKANAISNIQSMNTDILYASSMLLAEEYEFDLLVNTSADDTLDDIYIVVSGVISDNDNRHNLSIAGTAQAENIDLSTSRFLCDDANSCQNVSSNVSYAIEVRKYGSTAWFTRYSSLGDGTYYFHVKAVDNAGNWGEASHYRINIAGGVISVAIVYPQDGHIFETKLDTGSITVKVAVTGNASVYVVSRHTGGEMHNSSAVNFSTTYEFTNISLELGRNELFAVATTPAGFVATSSVVYVVLSRGLETGTNKTLRVAYAGCASAPNPYLCYSSEGGSYVGVATETVGGAQAGFVQSETSGNTIKIFMSRPFNVNSVADKLEDNSLLDAKTPSFGFSDAKGSYVVQNELRYDDVVISGDVRILPGTHDVYIINNGLTADGKVNLTIMVK